MKKLLIASSLVPVLAVALMAAPALADYHEGSHGTTITISSSNSASVTNNVNTSSNTGGNSVKGNGFIGTGDAASIVGVETDLNSNLTSVNLCGCSNNVKSITVANTNGAGVTNNVNTSSNTGGNSVTTTQSHSWHHEHSSQNGGAIFTGDAYSNATVVTIANSNITKLN